MIPRWANLLQQQVCLQKLLTPRPTCHSALRQLSSATGDPSTGTGPVADVAIVGGGMVGAALAALLAANPLTSSMRILLVDQQAQSSTWVPPAVPELRVSTVTPATINCLERAGAWQQVEQNSAPFSTMQVWDVAGPGCIRWHAQAAGRDTIGVVAENSLLQASLLGAIRGSGGSGSGSESQGLRVVASAAALGLLQPGVTCLWPVKLERLQLPPASPSASGTPVGATVGEAAAAAAAGETGPVAQTRPGLSQWGETGESGTPSPGPQTTPAGCSLASMVFEGGVTVRARLVVAADGTMSRVRSLAGLRTWGWPYHQRGLVATVRLRDGGTNTAWQRFLPTGPLALLPVRDGLANIVWSTTPAMAAQLERASPKEFAAAANQALTAMPSSPWSEGVVGSSLAGLAQTLAQAVPQGSDPFHVPPVVEAWVGSQPRSFPLQLKQSGRYVRPRLALIGDAAHAVHPLAGQGVNLGFGDAEVLADALARTVQCGGDPGDIIMLQDDYERPRQRAVMAMTTALDTLQRIFSVQVPPLAAARNLGLGLLNVTPPVKNQIMKFAMGL